MKRKVLLSVVLAVVAAIACAYIAGCSSGGDTAEPDLKDTREVTWEDKILTVNVGTNKSTGCEWKVEIGDDTIIGYGIKRVFHLSDEVAKSGEAVGVSEITFEGKGAGETTITLTTPNDWEGNEPGYTYTVTVTVNEDGTIANATAE